jgi:hypothetical protein
MPSQFFSGQVHLLLKRSLTLIQRLGSLPHLPAELQPHVAELSFTLNRIKVAIENLLNDPDFAAPSLLVNQFDSYKRLAELLNTFEWHPLALLDHYNDRDLFFYRFSKLFCEQIQYPYPPPLLSAHSNEYFSSVPPTNLISVPMAEDDHLLALPDYVHELGHLIYHHVWKKLLAQFIPHLQKYVDEQKLKTSSQAAKTYEDKLQLLEQSWLQRYAIEFFCDVFASYVVGAAYGWSHLRLVLSTQTELYRPSFGDTATHPADEARMRIILMTLERMGYEDAADALKRRWDALTTIFIAKPDGEYHFCYPDKVLVKFSELVTAQCQELDLLPFFDQPTDDKNLPRLMLEAWDQFHADPAAYAGWETTKVAALKSLLSGP